MARDLNQMVTQDRLISAMHMLVRMYQDQFSNHKIEYVELGFESFISDQDLIRSPSHV